MVEFDEDLLEALTPEERAKLDELIVTDPVRWRPLPGPQTVAFNSQATITGYGGAAGGGKTDLALGLALSCHQKVAIFRQEGPELEGIIERLTELHDGDRTGYNGQERVWRTKRFDGKPVKIEFGSFPDTGDEKKYQGRPHDLLVFDEASNMRAEAPRFLMGWLRTTDPKQRCRVLLTFNPPTDPAGRWVIKFFGPWLDRMHPKPAKSGEIRWFAVVDGEDVEVPGPVAFPHKGKMITPQSRTFIASRVSDNPYLLNTGYLAQLDSLPEPLRSQMRDGDFYAGMEDSPWQVIPTAWVQAAMDRWVRPAVLPPMDSLGCDVARGGRDQTVIARRHGMWFDEPITHQGKTTPNGATVAGLVISALRDRAPVHIDVIGVGAAPYDYLRDARQQVVGVNVSEKTQGTDRSGRLRFANVRTELWWRMREMLDPVNNSGIALPKSSELLAELCTPKWRMRGPVLEVQSRDEILKSLGRSPDLASAYCLALIHTPKADFLTPLQEAARGSRREHNPYEDFA